MMSGHGKLRFTTDSVAALVLVDRCGEPQLPARSIGLS
jgi:hypothetical protein